jgi:hypothetical protein
VGVALEAASARKIDNAATRARNTFDIRSLMFDI